MDHNTNIERIKLINQALSDLDKDFVFVGGATLSLYVDTPAPEVRPTEDVDVLVEIYTYPETVQTEEKLRSLGFTNVKDAGFIYRYRFQDILVDMMPLNEEGLGFQNTWYKEGFKHAKNYEIEENHWVKIFQPIYFLAAKLEAFKNRGKEDGRLSKDFEDIVFVLENRRIIWEELHQAEGSLKAYLQETFQSLQENPHFPEWVSAHTEPISPPATDMILDNLQKFVTSE